MATSCLNAHARTYTLERVIDGDTIVVRIESECEAVGTYCQPVLTRDWYFNKKNNK